MTDENIKFALEVAGMVGAFGLQSWAIVKFLMSRMDTQHEKAMGEIADVREKFVLKEDFNRHADQFREEMKAMRAESETSRNTLMNMLTNLGVSLNTRLDSLLLMMGSQSNGRKPPR